MITSNFYDKKCTKWDIQSEDKLLIGKLAHANSNNPTIGIIDVYFSISNGKTEVARAEDLKENTLNITNKMPEVFVRGGFDQFEKRYGYNTLFIFKATLDTRQSDHGNCKYLADFHNQNNQYHSKLTKDCPFIAEISSTPFCSETLELSPSTENVIENIDNDELDTYYFFQHDEKSKKILGPLLSNDKKRYHGPDKKIQYEFWNNRYLSDYETFLINYNGYESHIIDCTINDKSRKFLINLDSFYITANNKFRSHDFKKVDLIPENCLLNAFYESSDKAEISKVISKNKIKNWLNNKSLKLDSERTNRLGTLLTSYDRNNKDISKIYKNILNSSLADDLLKQLAQDDEERYLERFRNKEHSALKLLTQEIEEQRGEIEQKNDALKKQYNSSKHQLEETNKKRDIIQREIDTTLTNKLENIEDSEEYKDRLNKASEELAEINNKIEEAKEKYGPYEDLDKLAEEKIKKEAVLEDLTERTNKQNKKIRNFDDEVTDILDKAIINLGKNATDLSSKYLENKIINEFLSTDLFKQKDKSAPIEEFDEHCYATEISSQLETEHDRQTIINDLYSRFTKMNRNISIEFLEAALITIMQNKFTVFVGNPGTGKTSFATQLGCALGNSKSTLTVPVSKDWCRPKDLVGYFNPISNKYESGVTNFYPFFKSLNKFKEEETTNSFLILDEFNLSQPEFYLSNLINIQDNPSSRHINLGNNISVAIPNTSRFICTANTDDTVQGLSPRMISRCAFVHFNELSNLDSMVNELIYPDDMPALLSGTDMINLFSANESDILSDLEKANIDKLINIMRNNSDIYGEGINIVPRKYNKILQFCKVMNSQEYGQSKVLDYAAVFFLLPLLSGNGCDFKERIKAIKEIAEELSLDEFVKHISTLIRNGENNFDHYRYRIG